MVRRLGTAYDNPAASDPDKERIMRTYRKHARGRWLVAAVCSLALAASGCDATLKATVEDGIITASQSLFGSFLNALIQLAQEQATSTSS